MTLEALDDVVLYLMEHFEQVIVNKGVYINITFIDDSTSLFKLEDEDALEFIKIIQKYKNRSDNQKTSRKDLDLIAQYIDISKKVDVVNTKVIVFSDENVYTFLLKEA